MQENRLPAFHTIGSASFTFCEVFTGVLDSSSPYSSTHKPILFPTESEQQESLQWRIMVAAMTICSTLNGYSARRTLRMYFMLFLCFFFFFYIHFVTFTGKSRRLHCIAHWCKSRRIPRSILLRIPPHFGPPPTQDTQHQKCILLI